jgi:ABC-type amino acid transport substrate-binding protein
MKETQSNSSPNKWLFIAIGVLAIIILLLLGWRITKLNFFGVVEVVPPATNTSVSIVQPSTSTPTNIPTSVPPTPTITPIPTVVISNADGLLAEILSRGTIVISTDPNFQPQSFLNPAGQRPADTKCASDQITSAELQGFDVDVSNQIGLRLGVETCFVTPSFDAITTGNWGNKWDISVGSLRITPERMKVLAFSSPYYYENGESPLAIAIDYSHSLPIKTLLATINQIVDDMHNDGTLSALSTQWFGKDLTTK